MHPEIVGIDQVGIHATPDRIIPANRSAVRRGSVPDNLVDDLEIDGVESIKKRSGPTVNEQPSAVAIKGGPVGI